MSTIKIQLDDLSDGAVEELLQEHFREMHKFSPADSIHALDSSSLRKPSLTFWTARIDNKLAACGALQEIHSKHAEIKSMRTSDFHLRKGIGAKILRHIIEEAESRGYLKLSLETGTNDAFIPARKLYEQFGFQECEPFGSYKLDPYSIFFTKELLG